MKKVLNKISILTLLLFAFFFAFAPRVEAAVPLRGYYIRSNSSCSFQGQYFYLKGKTDGESMELRITGIYTINGAHAYCIEPGKHLYGGYDATSSTSLLSVDYKNSNYYFSNNPNTMNSKKTMIAQVLTFAKKISDPPTDDFSGCGKSDYLKAYAAQGLIWEIVTGERTSFTSVKPEKMYNYPKDNKCSFYNRVHNGTNCYLSAAAAVGTEYDRIVHAIQGSFRENPGETGKRFNPTGSASTVALQWDGSKYTLKINDTDFQYWDIVSDGGLTVTKDSGSVTISTNNTVQSIDKSAPKTVTIGIHNYNPATAVAYYSNNDKQDLVTIGGTTEKRAIKVYTNKYQLKITKKASLDGKVLSGAKFNICSDSACKTVLKTVTTGSDGTASYSGLIKPGTYYVKETAAPKGYTLNSAIKSVKVTSSNEAGTTSFGSITITDSNNIFNLTKYTVNENNKKVKLNDGCGTNTYTGPEFEIKEGNNKLCFKDLGSGKYEYASCGSSTTDKIKTCNGEFKVYTLPNCKYTITETKAPEGLTLPSSPSKNVDVCGSDKSVSFTNGFSGIEFQKKNSQGELVAGGKYSLQRKVDGVYKDLLLIEKEPGVYTYDSTATSSKAGATYFIVTPDGTAMINKLPTGEYRFVEKEAPAGYELIADKDSTAKVTISDSASSGYYLVEMVDRKVTIYGSEASAELVVAIITGRNVVNYIAVAGVLLILLGIAIYLRKKIKK